MDEIRLQSSLVKGFLAKLLMRWIRKKMGYDVNISFVSPVELSLDAGDAGKRSKLKVRVNMDISMDRENLEKLLGGVS